MSMVSYSNRRVTSRNELKINGFLMIGEYKERIIINNISLNGIQIVFSNNDFFYEYIKFSSPNAAPVVLLLNYFQYALEIKCIIDWLKIFDIGEKSFYILSGLIYEKSSFTMIKNEIVNLLVDMNMNKTYVDPIVQKENSFIG